VAAARNASSNVVRPDEAGPAIAQGRIEPRQAGRRERRGIGPLKRRQCRGQRAIEFSGAKG
jgi:hypothetical protein